MRRAFLLLALSCTGVLLASCDSQNPPDPIDVVFTATVTDLAAVPSSGRYTFFSLRDNRVVPNSDSLTRRWDVAFRGTTLLVNGGVGRVGEGAAQIVPGPFETVTSAPTSGYSEDGGIALAIPPTNGDGWYETTPQNVVLPIPNRVIVLRTGDGRYAKLQILSYYRGAPGVPSPSSDGGYYTFRYLFQPDGSRSFDSN